MISRTKASDQLFIDKVPAPAVTIISVVKNGAKHFQSTIDSIRSQTYRNLQYLVIDGGSTDGTLSIINQNLDVIDDWISEHDDGLYDAMNKGIGRAEGDYIGIVNSDDILFPHAVEVIVKAFASLGTPGYSCAGIEIIDHAGDFCGASIPLDGAQRWRRRFLEMPCAHLGVFVHKEVYEKLGNFDTSFKFSADYDLLLRFMMARVPCVTIKPPIGQFRLGGMSGGSKTWRDTYAVHRKHGLTVSRAACLYVRSCAKAIIYRYIPRNIKRAISSVTLSKHQSF